MRARASLRAALQGGVMAGAEVTVSSRELMAVKEEEGECSGNNHKTQVILHLQPILHGKAEGEEVEYGYPITCGDSRAVLLFKKFVCPGINVRCVKFNDQLISPKQFVHLAGKATLKDWKRAIRLGGVMLRKMMDSGQIDFYQHDTVCSNTCRSTKFDVLINSTRLPPGTSVQPSLSCLALDPAGGQVVLLARSSPENQTSSLQNEVLSLWKGVADSGLMGEVLSSLQTELLTTFKGVELRSERANLQETDAVILNSLCEMFGLLDSVKQTLDLRRSRNEENKIHSMLDEILEEQRKKSCDKSTIYKTSSLKHLRPQRQSQSNSQNLLSSVKTSSVIQPLSVPGLSAASYAQLTINPQLFTHFSALTGQHHRAGAGRTDRDGHGATLEREYEISEAGNQEKVHRLGQTGSEKKDTSGIHKEPGQRETVKFREDSGIRSDAAEETEGLHDIEKVIIGRKASKKHKSK
uniref:Glucocorticoid modulatory element-binding protein 1-like n=1 Tax=Acanthochromis polyacanthus TaxID=80966 RepID=A0A3Q1GNL6_9TELE